MITAGVDIGSRTTKTVIVDEDNNVRVRLQGACKGCPGAQMTLKNGVERLLKEKIPEVKEVIAVD